MTDEKTEWVTVKVPESDRDECKEIRPNSATFGDCLVAGAKLLSGGEGVQEAPEDFQPDGPDAAEIADEVIGRMDMAADPGAPVTDADVSEVAEQVRQLQRMVERVPEDTAEIVGRKHA